MSLSATRIISDWRSAADAASVCCRTGLAPDDAAHLTCLQAIVVDLQHTGVLRALFQQEEAEAAAAEGHHKAGGTPSQVAGDATNDPTETLPDAESAAQCAASADSRTGKCGAVPQANGGAFQRLTSSRYVDGNSSCESCTTAAVIDCCMSSARCWAVPPHENLCQACQECC